VGGLLIGWWVGGGLVLFTFPLRSAEVLTALLA
jgi:hypothetical protein